MKATSAHNPRYTGADTLAPPASCAWPDCGKAGLYRAPRDRDNLRDYVMFCLDHVRDYNARWNFFAGMSPAEIEHFRHADLTGHRPTWPLGQRHAPFPVRLDPDDSLGPFGTAVPRPDPKPALDPEERRALGVLGLDVPVALEALKARFKQLVKRLHPDANAGDRRSEDRLRLVIQAYRLLAARWRR
ncbi:MAG: J domain-containing protein [Alphaproteobacteria bacterium]